MRSKKELLLTEKHLFFQSLRNGQEYHLSVLNEKIEKRLTQEERELVLQGEKLDSEKRLKLC